MQTLTLFFAFAIVAIAMEKFTAEFLSVKTSDADAKGLPEIISRANPGYEFGLRGTSGKEKVIIRDGANKTEATLDKKQRFTVKNSKIVIEYKNDECCKPDRNVMFRSDYPAKISTANNTFPENYEVKWNCSSCPDKSKPKRMDMLSRMDPLDKMIDRCGDVRNTTGDTLEEMKSAFCDNCKILEGGQFCGPGNYTIEFLQEGQCKDVTFGGCKIPPGEILKNETRVSTPQICNQICEQTSYCVFYRYHAQSRNCTLLRIQNRALHCNIRAAPVDKLASLCLQVENDQVCDTLVQEECEYNGKVLRPFDNGQIVAADTCEELCKGDPLCKYWTYYQQERKCTLYEEDKKTCAVIGGPKDPTFDYCQKHHPNFNLP